MKCFENFQLVGCRVPLSHALTTLEMDFPTRRHENGVLSRLLSLMHRQYKRWDKVYARNSIKIPSVINLIYPIFNDLLGEAA